MNILLLGPQGSGKGTQAKRISAEYGIPHIATGDMLRAAMEQGTELGRRVKPIVDAGELVPDELMVELIRERLGEDDAREGFVLDGFPRTMPQARALDAMLREIGRELTVIFALHVSEEVCIERLLKRAVEEGRSDDTPEAIRRRLRRYYEETEPLIEHYRASTGRVVGIHADRRPDEVFAEIRSALDQVASRSSSGEPAGAT
jgi:adenylate kinase